MLGRLKVKSKSLNLNPGRMFPLDEQNRLLLARVKKYKTDPAGKELTSVTAFSVWKREFVSTVLWSQNFIKFR